MSSTPSHALSLADQAKGLVAASSMGTLATLDPRTGHPYASLVQVLPDEVGGAVFLISTLASLVQVLPDEVGGAVFLISTLAAHTTHLTHDPRASLLVSDPLGAEAPLAHGRATLMGEVHKVGDQERWRAGWVALHPGSERVLGFGDFSFWQLKVTRVRFIAGFGKMGWLESDDYLGGEPDMLCGSRAGIIAHMNEDHRANLVDYAHAFAKADWASDATMVEIDRFGFDLELTGDHPESGQRVRVAFPAPLLQPSQVRAQLVGMAQGARAMLGKGTQD